MIENISDSIGMKGHIRLDLLDPDTKKIKESVEHDNAVMSSINKYWQTLQKIYWMAGNNNNGNGMTGRLALPPVMSTHVMLTTDTTTPTSTSNVLSGDVIGYASRWNSAISGTKRGSLNTSLCSLNDSQSQFVWDWSPSAANGTFQTISFGTVHNTTEKYLTESAELYTTGGLHSGWGGTGTSANALSSGASNTALCHSSGTTYISYASGTGATGAPVVATIDPVNGGAATALFTCSGTSPAVLLPATVHCMVRLSSGDFILGTSAGLTGVSSTGVTQWTNSGLAGSAVVTSLATDGTTVWGTRDNSADIFTVSTSNSALTDAQRMTSLISTGASASSTFAPKVAYNGTNLLVLCTNTAVTAFELRTYTTAGSLVSTSNNQWWHAMFSETGVSPFTTGSIFYPPDGGGSYSISAASSTTQPGSGIATLSGSGQTTIQAPFLSFATTNTSGGVTRRTSPWGLNWGPDGLWFKYYQEIGHTTGAPGFGWAIYKISYNNVSTRALLASPFTKTSANALRLTYTISFT